MRFSLLSAALFATAMALPMTSEIEARSIMKFPSFGKKGSSSSSDDSGSDGGDGGSGSSAYDVKGQIQTLDSDVKSLTDLVNAFNGDSFKALDIMKSADHLIADIQAGLTGTQNSPKIPFADGVMILPVFTSFVPDTKAAMTALTAKQAMFAKAGVTSVVLDKLQKIQTLGQSFDQAVVQKLDALSKPFGKAVYSPVNQSLLDEIKSFQSGGAGAAAAGGDAAAAPADTSADDSS